MTNTKFLDLKKKITQIYDSNQKIKNKINLDIQVKDISDIAFDEFRKEIYDSYNSNFIENDKKVDSENITEFEEVQSDIESENYFDLSILEKIDEKVLSILQYLNVGYFLKNELKNKIIIDMLNYLNELGKDEKITEKIFSSIPSVLSKKDMLERILKLNDFQLKLFFVQCYPKRKSNKERNFDTKVLIEDRIKVWFIINSIPWYIENHIDHEFKEYELKKNQMKKELLQDLINQIVPEVNIFFESHKKSRLKKVNKNQIDNFLKFIFDYLDNKYIKIDKKNKKLNNEDYIFLKNKIKRFIMEKYIITFLKKT